MIARVSIPFLRLLCNLRWLAVAGQSITVLVVTGPMQVALPVAPLWGCIGLLSLFNVYATWYVRQSREASAAQIFLHLSADILALTWLVVWSGGIDNPFASLFLLPIALAIVALPRRWVWATSVACGAGYAVSTLIGRQLPHVHAFMGDAFNLHRLGMLVNFLVSAVVLLVFLSRMAAASRLNEREVARLREQFARNEGIVALATHAASVAHELNTPLGTLTLMVEELAGDAKTLVQQESCATMQALLGICRDRVRELAMPADAAGRARADADVDLRQIIERWRLIRPAIDLQRTIAIAGYEKVESSVGHLLQALLNNAADAGEQQGTPRVDLKLLGDATGLRGEIRDYGAGFDVKEPVLPSTLFMSGKSGGLGIGLALSHATIERLGCELSMQAAADGNGVRVFFRLPARARA
ncbi:MAG: ATP-binding protein [Steroidobacteraceae bacterium]